MRQTLNWARLVSNVMSPPAIWGMLALPVAIHGATNLEDGLIQSGLYISFVCIIPTLYIAWMLYRGHIADIHLPDQKDRLRPFLFTIASTTVVLLILAAISSTPTMPIFALGTLIQIIFMTIITQLWKISIHTMAVSSGVVTIGVFFGLLPALLLSPLIPLVGAARLKLHRHSPAQVVIGALLGMITVLLLALSFGLI